MQIRKQW